MKLYLSGQSLNISMKLCLSTQSCKDEYEIMSFWTVTKTKPRNYIFLDSHLTINMKLVSVIKIIQLKRQKFKIN